MKGVAMKRFFCMVIGLCLAFCSRSALAQNAQTIDLRIPYFSQRQPTWSWLAVVQMLIKYYDQNSTMKQCEYLERLYHVAPNTYCNHESRMALPDLDLERVQELLAVNGKVYTKFIAPIDASEMYTLLQYGKPIIVKVKESYSTTRTLIVRGMRFRQETSQLSNGQQVVFLVPYVILNDPAIHDGPLEVPYTQLRSSWIDAIVVMSTDDAVLNGTCGVLNQVISTLPRMEPIIGELDFGEGDIGDYGALVRLPGLFTSCVVTIDNSGSWPTYTFKCDVNSNEKDCSEVYAVIRDEFDEVRGCFPGQKSTTKWFGKSFEVRHELYLRSMGAKITMLVRRTNTPPGSCVGVLFLSID